MMKIMIIDFTKVNCCGNVDYVSRYYVNGKRIRKNEFYKYYSRPDSWKWEFVRHEERDDVNKDGVLRHYCVNYFKNRNNH